MTITLNYHESKKCANCSNIIGFDKVHCKKCINGSKFSGSCRTCLFDNSSWYCSTCVTCYGKDRQQAINQYERNPCFLYYADL